MKNTPSFAGALLAALLASSCSRTQRSAEPLVCHVDGTMTPVIEKIAQAYTAETGVRIEINSAASSELLDHIQGQRSGDLYVCHDPFIDILMQTWKLGADGWQIAELTPGIVVPRGNPLKIRGLHDLTRADVRLILTDYQLCSLGVMLPTIFSKAGIDFDRLNRDKKILSSKSAGYSANSVKTRNADAAIVWKALWKLSEDALDYTPLDEYLPIPYADSVTSATRKKYWLTPVRVTVATLKSSKQPAEARKFAEFLASTRCVSTLDDFGFVASGSRKLYENGRALPAAADAPAAQGDSKPVVLYADAGVRRAVDALIVAFRGKTGITVEADYGGSGTILARAVESTRADIFMPGDIWYVDQLQETTGKVESRHDICYFVPTIIVGRGNPKGVQGVEDFARPDLRIAVGEASSCQIGRSTAAILAQYGVDAAALRATESMTVNELGVWVKMNNADAAIVWDATAASLGEDVDVIAIPQDKNIVSAVVAGILRTGDRKEQARAFIDFMTGAEGRRILEDKGYTTNLQ